jgi:hypothetical protein
MYVIKEVNLFQDYDKFHCYEKCPALSFLFSSSNMYMFETPILAFLMAHNHLVNVYCILVWANSPDYVNRDYGGIHVCLLALSVEYVIVGEQQFEV